MSTKNSSKISTLETKINDLETSLEIAKKKIASLEMELEVARFPGKVSLEEALEIKITNSALEVKQFGSLYQVAFNSTYYFSNQQFCKKYLQKLANVAKEKGLRAEFKSSWLELVK